MKSDDMPMWEDPAESDVVRNLLEAGRNAQVDYDVAQGLSQHIAHIQTGAPLPKWAQSGGLGGASTGSLVTWIVVPVVTASVVAAVWVSTRESAPQPKAERPIAAVVEQAPAAGGSVRAVATAATPDGLAVVETETEVGADSDRAAVRTRSVSRKAHGTSPRIARSGATVGARASASDELPLKVDSAGAARSTSTASASSRSSATARDSSEREQSATAQASERAAAEEATAPADSAREAKAEQSESKLEREMQMLAVAQRVLADDPSRALRLAEQGEREFASSMFSAERKNVAALALVKLGRLDEARRVGKPLLAKYPNAPFSQRLRQALVSGRVE